MVVRNDITKGTNVFRCKGSEARSGMTGVECVTTAVLERMEVIISRRWLETPIWIPEEMCGGQSHLGVSGSLRSWGGATDFSRARPDREEL